MYPYISTAFSVIVIMGNIISAKMFKLPFFQDFSIPAGLVAYPLTFFLSNVVTEWYGSSSARKMVYQAFAMSVLAFLLIEMALFLPSPSPENAAEVAHVLGVNRTVVLGSLTAYLCSQMLEIRVYGWMKRATGERHLWLRSNGSTLIVQLCDTVIANFIFLKLGLGMNLSQMMPIMAFSYFYKGFFSVMCTPLFYCIAWYFKKERGVCRTQASLSA